jgi:hypothetical protein
MESIVNEVLLYKREPARYFLSEQFGLKYQERKHTVHQIALATFSLKEHDVLMGLAQLHHAHTQATHTTPYLPHTDTRLRSPHLSTPPVLWHLRHKSLAFVCRLTSASTSTASFKTLPDLQAVGAFDPTKHLRANPICTPTRRGHHHPHRHCLPAGAAPQEHTTAHA